MNESPDTPAGDGSAYHEYALTEKGRELFSLIVALRQWGEDHLFEDGERLEVVDATGRRLTSLDTFVRKVSH